MIRTATKGDLEEVYGLIRQLSRHDFTKEQFEACYLYNLEKSSILVSEENKNICGCGVLDIHYSLHFSQKSAEIVNLVVEENARNRGMGKELLAALEQLAADCGCVCIEVGSGKQREDAHRFYYREGYECNHCKFTKRLNNAANIL